ncbi:MAG: ATP-binding protein [Clostridia bacterium]|nr:ATP-binding protein [Clostridia bacterium]
MKELSLNILDIAQNSIKAGAAHIGVFLEETADTLEMTIRDDGCGMTQDVLRGVTDPFYTTRTTRSVGMGIPLLKLAAEQTGGSFSIESVSESDDPASHGTTVRALFHKNHLDYTPLGDVVSTVCTLIQGAPDTDWHFRHRMGERTVEIDTAEMRQVLGGVPLDSFEVLDWIRQSLLEEYAGFDTQ